MSPENAERLKEVHSTALQIFPHLMNFGTSAEGEVTKPETSFTADVEEEANSYYERVYRQEITIDDVIKLLQKFKNSSDRRENNIFSCMVHNLFDEYQFFSKYPQRELTITSVIFGSLIQYQLVEYYALGIALRYVLNSLRNPADSKMFTFGAQALRQFQSRLPEWPQYCSHLLQIPQLQQAYPDIIMTVRNSLAANSNSSTTPPAGTSNAINYTKPVPEPLNKVIDRPAFTALNLDTLLAADKVDYEIPSEAVQDKILFIINNVAQSNLETKVSEMKELLKESHYRWFANYLVVKRSSIEPNYHQLYLQFLDSLESPLLNKHVLRETFANIKILLNSQKTIESASERSLLKNLGSWLGGMTLARYDSNRLLVAIPFVCKVLEQASKSKVFKPPNPWLMAIIKLLAELYQFADLKLNLKFEVEVLCKSLDIDLKEIEATTMLKDRPPKETTTTQSTRFIHEFEKWSTGNDYGTSSKPVPVTSQMTSIPNTPTSHMPNISLPVN
ncbi:5031_t:CDS:2, partial [Diversispora eburnea]